jgi:hypothetical protein
MFRTTALTAALLTPIAHRVAPARRIIALAAVTLGLASSAPPATADIITTLADQNVPVGFWGSVPGGFTPTFGQTFTATTNNSVLLSMTFSIDNHSLVSIPYRAFVIGWTGNDLVGTITGSELFSGPPSSVASTMHSQYQLVTQDTGALQLIPGHQYLAAFTTIDQGGTTGAANWGFIMGFDAYSGGGFAFNNATTLAGLSSNWNPNEGFIPDLAFELKFATVPAPPAVVLVGLGAGCVALRRYVGRRATA